MTDAPFSLFVHRVSQNFSEYRQYNLTLDGYTGRITPCAAACDGLIADDCIPSYRYLPEGVCFRGARGGSWIFRKRPVNTSLEYQVHDQCYFEDVDCASPPKDCIGTKLDLCSPSSGQLYQELNEWCIRSSEPRGEFSIPLVTFQTYNALNVNEPLECSTASFTEYFVPVQDQTCSVANVRIGNRFALGSAVRFCSQNDYYSQNFADASCTTTTSPNGEDLFQPLFNLSNNICETVEVGTIHQQVVDCDAPSIYCKDMVEVLPGLSRRESPATLSPDMDMPSSSSSVSAASSLLLVSPLPAILIGIALFLRR